ncbi:MAG TPA: hypothetical protein VHQ41_03610 [Patescibacteria group bacterium]|nr:hypothetical protein [Patescibacteria group bacterium]
MSKKNRYKFRQPAAAVPQTHNVLAGEAPAASPASAPVQNSGRVSASAAAMNQHVAEYNIISKDLIRLVVLNGLMLAAVLVVYFTNRNTGYLERMFQNLLH